MFGPAKVAVFLDGCFWHGCPTHGKLPKNNHDWWVDKLTANRERDERADRALEALGWISLRFWEHESPPVIAKAIQEKVIMRRVSWNG